MLIGVVIGIAYRKKIAEGKVGVAEERANKIVEDAVKDAEAKKKEILLEAKEESIKTKMNWKERFVTEETSFRKMKDGCSKRRNSGQEDRGSGKKRRAHGQKAGDLDRQKEEARELREKQLRELERISGLTTEEAKNHILAMVENDVKHEATLLIKETESKAKMEAEKRSREIVANAIQRCAVDHVAETTVSVVQLPNDEMKGRTSAVKAETFVPWKH